MSERTKSAFENVAKKIKSVIKILGGIGQLVYIIYLAFALKNDIGHRVVNFALLFLTAIYFIFYLIFFGKKSGKKTYKKLTKAKKFAKLGIKAFSLGVSIYALYSSAAGPSIISIFLSIVMIVGWFISIALEILLIVVSKRAKRIVGGFTDNIQKLTKKDRKENIVENVETFNRQEAADEGLGQIQNKNGKSGVLNSILQKFKK